jgi:hypothetical protein
MDAISARVQGHGKNVATRASRTAVDPWRGHWPSCSHARRGKRAVSSMLALACRQPCPASISRSRGQPSGVDGPVRHWSPAGLAARTRAAGARACGSPTRGERPPNVPSVRTLNLRAKPWPKRAGSGQVQPSYPSRIGAYAQPTESRFLDPPRRRRGERSRRSRALRPCGRFVERPPIACIRGKWSSGRPG